MAVTMAVKVLEIDVQVLTKKSRIPVTIPVKKEAMLFHVSTKNVLMEVQTSFQLVPPQHHIGNAFQGIHDITERVDNEIPDRRKNTLDSIPALLPVASKQTDQSIQQPQKNTSKLWKDVGDVLKNTFKNGS